MYRTDRDRLVIYFQASSCPMERRNGMADVLAALAAATAVAPDIVLVGKREQKLTPAAVEKALAAGRFGDTQFIAFRRKADPEVSYRFTFLPDDPIGMRLEANAPLDEIDAARAEAVVALFISLAERFPAVYGYAHSEADRDLGSDPHVADPAAEKRVYEAYWLNVYGSAMVDAIGRERVRTVPCERRIELAQGAELFLTSESPRDFAAPTARQAQARGLAHLRGETFDAGAAATLERRSRMFDEVEPQFDPDIADLLMLTLDTVDFGHRQQKIAELNQYRPPPSRRSDPRQRNPRRLPSPEAELERYGDQAERLVALLHTKVPGVLEGGPDTLPAIDHYFWWQDYPRVFKREDVENDLVPAIGAYLGELMVRHLGGHWVPAATLDESAVVVGNTAWLPFQRARHYMANRQSALDSSLTQFYRTAARARTVH